MEYARNQIAYRLLQVFNAAPIYSGASPLFFKSFKEGVNSGISPSKTIRGVSAYLAKCI